MGAFFAVPAPPLASYLDVTAGGRVTFGRNVSAVQMAQNTAAAVAATAAAIAGGYRGVWFPPRDIALAPQSTGQQPLLPYQADEFKYVSEGCRLWLGGTNRSNSTGAAQFQACTGSSGFVGSWTIDVLNPWYNQGIVTAIVPGQYIEVLLDWAPTWTDVKNMYTWLKGVPQAFILLAGGPDQVSTGVAMSNTAGLTYRIDLTGSNGTSPTTLNLAALAVGSEVVLQHQQYGPCAISGFDNDRIVIPSGLTINGAHGSGIAFYTTALDFEGKIEAPLIRTARGLLRRRLASSSDGIDVAAGGRGTRIGATARVFDTGDDCVNLNGYVAPVVSLDSPTQITVSVNTPVYGFPVVGDTVNFIDPTGKYQGSAVVRSTNATLNVLNVPTGTTAQLTFASNVPPGLNNAWEINTASGSDNYVIEDGFHCGRSRSAGIRLNTVRARVGAVYVVDTMGPLMSMGGSGATEYSAPSIETIGPLVGHHVNAGQGAETAAALYIAPLMQSGAPVTAAGVFGRIRVKGLDVTDTNGPLFSISGPAELLLENVRGTGINATQGGTVIGTLANISTAEIAGASVFGSKAATLPCSNVGTLTVDKAAAERIVAPQSGVANLQFSGTWSNYTPTFKSSGGTLGPVTVNSARFATDGSTTTVYLDFVLPNPLTGASGALFISPPRPVGQAGGIGKGRDESVGDALTVEVDPNSPQMIVYRNANDTPFYETGTSNPASGATFVLTVIYEAATNN